MNKLKLKIVVYIALAMEAGSLFAGQPFITSFQQNGQLTWTNAPGTNTFAVQRAPAVTGPWSNAAPPLDSIITTNTRTTVSVPIVRPTGFYRVVAQGFGPQSLRGTWIFTPPGVTSIGGLYFTADGAGFLSNVGLFELHNPPGYYTVSNSGGVMLVVEGNETFTLFGQFVDANNFVPTGPFTSVFGRGVRVQNVSLCAGNWTGTLSEMKNPKGVKIYSVSLTVSADGSASLSSPSLGTTEQPAVGSGLMFALAPANGALSSFIKTGLASNNPYNQIQISGTLTGNSISGSFETDSGNDASAVKGTVTLTRQ